MVKSKRDILGRLVDLWKLIVFLWNAPSTTIKIVLAICIVGESMVSWLFNHPTLITIFRGCLETVGALCIVTLAMGWLIRQRENRRSPIGRHFTAHVSELDDGHFGAIWELFLEVETQGTSDQMPSQNTLTRFAGWPDITKLSCSLFGNAAFTHSTWDQLTVWLMKLSRGKPLRCAAMPCSSIVELLREAVAEKQKTDSVSGVTNQELRLLLSDLKAEISSSSEVLRRIREYIAENGVVDSAVRNLLAEKSSDAGDVIDRLGCLLGGGVLFPK
jgi:hypothetical protein